MFIATLKTPDGRLLPLQVFAKSKEEAEKAAQSACGKGWTVVAVN